MRQNRRAIPFAILWVFIALVLVACAGDADPTPEPTATGQIILPPMPSPTDAPAPAETQLTIEPVLSTVNIVWTESSPNPNETVEGSESTLTRMEHGLYMTFQTNGLEPGYAYTIWWIIFNRPENCSDGECGLEDSFMIDEFGQTMTNEDGSPQANLLAREATEFSVLRGTGMVVDEDGTGEFRAHLPVGDVSEAGFGPGLLDSIRAEIHLVVRSHGPATAGILFDQVNTPWGGCPDSWPKDPCADLQFAVHRPSEV